VRLVSNPFVDPDRQGALYADASRLARRSGALNRAKVAGSFVPGTIVQLARAFVPRSGRNLRLVADVGCGRGTSSRVLAHDLSPQVFVGVDASRNMVTVARQRTGTQAGTRIAFVQADFHRLPFPDDACDLVVAAFCLYHSRTPARAVAELGRILAPSGLAVLVTKSVDSYREMDALVAAAGLDPRAQQHKSLYAEAHGGNLANLTRQSLDVRAILHEDHRFRFPDLDHAAEYLATSPKYDLAAGLYGNPDALSAALRERLPDQPVTTTSTVTYVVAQPGRTLP
jgi:ubiquinone/menaquinone biosynthesis C-methylase UbiE